MTGHNSNRIWALSLPKLRQVENERREADTSKARQFKTCGQHRDIRHGTASGRQICCKAQLVPSHHPVPQKQSVQVKLNVTGCHASSVTAA